MVAELAAPEGTNAETTVTNAETTPTTTVEMTATTKNELPPQTEDVAAVALQPAPRPPTVRLSSSAPAAPPEPDGRLVAVAPDLDSCAQPTGRVPLSDACNQARAVSPLLPPVGLPTNLPAAVTAISEATRGVSRQRDNQMAAERDERKKPPSVVAVPAGSAQDDTLASGGGSSGGSTGGARTLRIDAIHQRLSPLQPPSTFQQAPIPDLIPTGELQAPPTARPG
jgi:hypothetical protein